MIILRNKTFAEITQLPSLPQTLPSQQNLPTIVNNQQTTNTGASGNWLSNKWNNLSNSQKWTARATGAALVTGALALRANKKRKEAEEELERERRRR